MKYSFLLLLTVATLLVSCRDKPEGTGFILPEDPNKAAPELCELRRLAHDGNEVQREKARGKLLGHLRMGMRKQHVELWMGKPAAERTGQLETYETGIIAKYYCWIPGIEGKYVEGTHLMTIIYEQGEDGLRMVSVEGPHFPD